jgi:Arc/MetJ family transcription regulator
MRTNIDIDDKLMKQAMKATGAATKKAAVEASLRRLVALKLHERNVAERFRLQEAGRQAAARDGRLDEWFAGLKKNGNYPDFPTDAQVEAWEPPTPNARANG